MPINRAFVLKPEERRGAGPIDIFGEQISLKLWAPIATAIRA
jgi:hypothetical protein